MPIFNQISIPMSPYSGIRTLQLVKVSFLVTFLVVLPRLVGYLNVVDMGTGYFSGVTLSDILLRIAVYFGFSLLLLEIHVNGHRIFPAIKQLFRLIGVYAITILLVWATTELFRFSYPKVVEMGPGDTIPKYVEIIFILLAIILIFISSIINLQKARHDKILENAELKQQNLQKELSALKNQVNPHFLFNSLNSLSALVRDNDKASTFVKNLSFLYRYILQSGDLDLVTVHEELRFLKSYMELIKVRYGEKISFNITVNDELMSKQIPPLALQLLVENAVKHNEISDKYPLEINLFSSTESLVVENRIRPRKSLVQSGGVGLSNLDKRYHLLMGHHIRIKKKEGIFRVELPIFDKR